MSPASNSFAQRERQALCDLLQELGPDVPTLCRGWRSADLAAHLYVRDHRPDAGPGMVVGLAPFKVWTDHVQKQARDTLSWDDLVSRVRKGPPGWLKPLDAGMNTIEYFVHCEDLRRAQAGWEPRPLSAEDAAQLWRRAGVAKAQAAIAGLLPGHDKPAARLEAEGFKPLVLSKKPGAVVRGPVGEVVMWAMGRREACRVEVSPS